MRQAAGLMLGVPFFLVNLFLAPLSHADNTSEIQTLKQQVQTLQRTVEQLQQTLQTMQQGPGSRTSPPSALNNPHSSRELPSHHKENLRSIARCKNSKGGSHEQERKQTCGLVDSGQPISV